MKRKVTLRPALLLVALLLFQGCGLAPARQEGAKTLDLTELTPFYTASGANAPQIMGISDRFALFSQGMQGKTHFYASAFNSQSPLVRLGESGACLVASGSQVMMGDACYHVALEPSPEGEQLRLLCADAQNQKVTVARVLEGTQQLNPLVYLSKRSAEEFLYILVDGYTSSLLCHNIKTQQTELLLEETATLQGGRVSGDLFSRVSACNGLIYLLTNEIKDDLSHYVLRVYDKSGALKKTLTDERLGVLFENAAPLGMEVVGSCVMLENWNMEQAIFQIKGDALEELVPASARMRVFSSGLSNFYRSLPEQVVVYRSELTDEGKSAQQTLFFLNPNTGETRSVECLVEEGKSLGFGLVGESGDLVLTVYQNEEGEQGKIDFNSYELYRLTARELWELLGELPGEAGEGLPMPPPTGTPQGAQPLSPPPKGDDPFAGIDFEAACQGAVAELQGLDAPISVQIEVNLQERYVRFVAALKPMEYPEDAAYADFEQEMIRCFHRHVQQQAPWLKGPDDGYYGELFDVYEIRLCVFAAKSWYDMDRLAPATHPELTTGPYGGGW